MRLGVSVQVKKEQKDYFFSDGKMSTSQLFRTLRYVFPLKRHCD